MQKIDFSNIRNISDLSKNLRVAEHDLKRLFNFYPQTALYKIMRIPKKNPKYKSYRTVYKAIDPTLILLQKNIETSINLTTEFPSYVHGFVRKRSIVSNAKKHLGRQFVLTMDIVNFFESITERSVVEVFTHLGCCSEIAECLARLCTLNGNLVQGLSTSPVLANLASRNMDNELFELARDYSCEYSRYSDDITFSGDIGIPSKEKLSIILNKYGFQLNHSKFKIQKRGAKQFVTGLTVFDKEYPRIPKRIKRWVRLNLFYTQKFGLESHVCKLLNISASDYEKDELKHKEVQEYCNTLKNKIKGWIDYINSVEPNLAKKYYEQYKYFEE